MAGGSRQITPLSGCTLPPFTMQATRAAVRGKWILFLGASTLLEIFSQLLGLALGGSPLNYQRFSGSARSSQEPVFNAQASTCPHHVWKTRDYDTGRTASRQLPNGTRLSVMYNGHVHACKSSQGLLSMVDEHGAVTQRGAWMDMVLRGGNATPGWIRAQFLRNGGTWGAERANRQKLMATHADDGASYGKPHGPDVVVFNSGVHDMGNPEFNLTLYESSLRNAWALLRAADRARQDAGAPPRQHIWMSVGAVYHRFVEGGQVSKPHHEDGGASEDGSGARSRGSGASLVLLSNCPLRENETNVEGVVRSKHVHGVPLVRLMNQIAHRVAREEQQPQKSSGSSRSYRPMKVDILDQEMARELSPHDGDGTHCGRGMVCAATVQYLLRLLELGSE